MGLFKGLSDKPYTKADYYRELEEKAAAKRAAVAANAVVVNPFREAAWIEPEEKKAVETVLQANIVEPVTEVPFETEAVVEQAVVAAVTEVVISAPTVIPEPTVMPEPVIVAESATISTPKETIETKTEIVSIEPKVAEQVTSVQKVNKRKKS
jgi:hypothetical protein